MKRVLMIVMCCLGAATLPAKPAYPGPVQKVQADGSRVTVYQHGDEHFHWMTNAKGEWIQLNDKGFYEQVPTLSDNEIQLRRQASRLRAPQATQQAMPINLAPHGLMILVNFQDVAFRDENSLEEMQKMINSDNYSHSYSYTYDGQQYDVVAKGSARQYFIDQSKGQYRPEFDVVGPFTVSKEMAYYGKNRTSQQGTDQHPEQMVKEACQLAHDAGVDFSIYDNDNDGKVDFVYIVYAGYGEADGGGTNTIWPHSYHLSYAGINLRLDNKRVDLYACGSELSYYTDHRDGIGTFCHEFGHVLGLPDIYEVSYTNNWKTSGFWDIMDSGCYNNDGNTPAGYTGYERLFFGWTTPHLLNTYGEVSLYDLQTKNDVCVITEDGTFNNVGNDPSPATFYVLDNRQQTKWDEYVPGHGLTITKVTYSYNRWSQNFVNDEAPLAVDLIEADGQAPKYKEGEKNGFNGKPGDCFPEGATEYLDIPNFAVTNISESAGIIRFSVQQPQSIEHLEAPQEDTMKVLHNGQVVIMRNGAKYSILGNRLD